MGYFPCSFSSSAGILTIWQELAIYTLDFWPEKPHQRQTEDFICKERVDAAQCQMERALVCESGPSWPWKHQLLAGTKLLLQSLWDLWYRAVLPLGTAGAVAEWRIKLLMVSFCLSWTSFSCHCLSFSLKASCWGAGQQALGLPSSWCCSASVWLGESTSAKQQRILYCSSGFVVLLNCNYFCVKIRKAFCYRGDSILPHAVCLLGLGTVWQGVSKKQSVYALWLQVLVYWIYYHLLLLQVW